MTQLNIIIDNKSVARFESNINECMIMKIFNIRSAKDIYIDSNGEIEFHCDDRNMMIYTNLKEKR